jgi:hypothetical protein
VLRFRCEDQRRRCVAVFPAQPLQEANRATVGFELRGSYHTRAGAQNALGRRPSRTRGGLPASCRIAAKA